MVAPISPLGANHTSLRLWAAYSSHTKGELHSEPEPVTPPPVTHAVTLETVAKPATLEMSAGLHIMTCKCTMCSPGLESIASPVGGAKILPVNLTGELSPEEKEMIEKLRARDAQVRKHEQAHLMAAGQHALGGAQYTYQVGPDGRRYAVGGEVQVDMSPINGDPEATLMKAQQLQRAALAPIDPSAADRNVAAAAAQMAQEARQDIAEEAQEERKERAEANGKRGADGVDTDNRSRIAPPDTLFPESLYAQKDAAEPGAVGHKDANRGRNGTKDPQDADSLMGLDFYA